MSTQKKSKSRYVAEEPKQGWAYFEDSNTWRKTPSPWGAPADHFPKDLGDWFAVSKPLGWQPPAGTLAGESLLGASGASLRMFAPAVDDAGAGGGHTKIGAGHKPQGYDEHGRYTGPSGGSIPTGGGPVRLYANGAESPNDDEAAGEDSANEPEAETGQEVPLELDGVLVADNGRIMSDAGGGLSGGNEVRGPVSREVRDPVPPPEKAPAEVTWRNDEADKPDPTLEDLHSTAQKTVDDMKTEVPKLESTNVNSGRRDKGVPHADGRAVDINNINGVRVVNLPTATGPKADQAREAAANLETWAKNKPEVTEIIGPTGWWRRDDNGDMQRKTPTRPEDIKTLEKHKNHYHITTKW